MKYYSLKRTIKAEPFVNSWYAWAYLISPLGLSFFTRNSHLVILKSYLDSPEIHAYAVADESMIGGPFIDTQGINRKHDVKELIDMTMNELADLLELAKDCQTFFLKLQEIANGKSIESLYAESPITLKGFVELCYDLANRPSFRVIEALLYHSNFYKNELQSVFFSTIYSDDRPFMLSTPIFSREGHVELRLPFNSNVYTEIFGSVDHPLSEDRLNAIAQIIAEPKKKDAFLNLFQQATVATTTRYFGDCIRIRYYGHACLLIESNNTSILIDPLISYAYEVDMDRYTLDDLPELIDYVLITHSHQDHFVIETLMQIKHKVKNIVVPRNNPMCLGDPSLKLISQKLGFDNIIALDEIESINFNDGRILSLPSFGEHGDLDILSKLSYLIEIKGRKIVCCADSNNIEPMLYARLKSLTTDIDVLFIGMECKGAPMSWLYGPVLMQALSYKQDQSRRLNGSDAAKAINLIEAFDCKNVYIYAMGQEPWLKFISSIEYSEESQPIIESDILLRHCKDKKILAERLFGSKEILM